jgi:class 3 adenylate cyclase
LSDIVNDLYTLKRGKWVLHEQYAGKDLGLAITEAKKLIKANDVEAVGIIREGTDSRTGELREKLAYGDAKKQGVPFLNDHEIAPMADQNHEAKKGSYFDESTMEDKGGDEGKSRKAARRAPEAAAPAVQRNAFALPIKLFTVAFIAMGVGWGVWASINHFGGTPVLADALGQANLPAKTMGLGFIIALFILLPTTISGADIAAAFRAAPARQPAPQASGRAPARAKSRQQSKKGGGKKKDKGDEDAEASDKSAKAEPEEKAEEPEKEEDALDPATGDKVAQARVALVAFFERCMAFVMASDPEMSKGRVDAVTSFGCQLFFAGAAEVLANGQRINLEHLGRIIEPVAVALGQDKKRAKQFAEKYESYLLEPSYLDMFRAGREAMQTVIDDEAKAAQKEQEAAEAPAKAPQKVRSPADDDFEDDWEDESDIGIFLAHALESWRAPNEKKGTMTAVLFTDIVGSTNITQKHGDEASQRMVNVHNSIVRGALQAHGGREVKHTGDGIMAAFSNPPASIDSAIDMQRGVAHYNTGKPDIELRLRVGISVGEPIAEDNDLFGTTVQMAARLCDGAGTDGIMITNLLKEMSQGRAVQYINVEPKEFKGITEPVQVSLVKWLAEKDD